MASDLIEMIKGLNDEYTKPQIKASVKSVQGEKIFINMIMDNSLLTNTEMSVYRSYIYQNENSIQSRIEHIKEFNECCANNRADEDCRRFNNLYEWSNEEYEDLIDQSHDFFKGNGIHNMGLYKTILVEEVYDSVAVGEIINNENICIKVMPGDILEMKK